MKKNILAAAIISAALASGLSSCGDVVDSLLEGDEPGQQDNGGDSAAEDKEVMRALDYLNEIRANPSQYTSISSHLKSVSPIHELRWNDNLAKAAQYKAEDMAKRQYFGHTDPEGYGMNYWINYYGYELEDFMLSSKSNNYFESIACGTSTARETINLLIEDGGAGNESAGHRRHLLGIDDYYASCYDIGIGRAYNQGSDYHYYWSVLIAKHTSH